MYQYGKHTLVHQYRTFKISVLKYFRQSGQQSIVVTNFRVNYFRLLTPAKNILAMQTIHYSKHLLSKQYHLHISLFRMSGLKFPT